MQENAISSGAEIRTQKKPFLWGENIFTKTRRLICLKNEILSVSVLRTDRSFQRTEFTKLIKLLMFACPPACLRYLAPTLIVHPHLVVNLPQHLALSPMALSPN